MTTAIVGTAASGGAALAAAAAVQAQAKQAAPAAAITTAAEDSVTLSATAQEVQQPTAVQVRVLRNEGQSVPQIATQLKIAASAVQSYLGAPAAASPKG
jgi:DNA-binding NarL/FixJ family response regulator